MTAESDPEIRAKERLYRGFTQVIIDYGEPLSDGERRHYQDIVADALVGTLGAFLARSPNAADADWRARLCRHMATDLDRRIVEAAGNIAAKPARPN